MKSAAQVIMSVHPIKPAETELVSIHVVLIIHVPQLLNAQWTITGLNVNVLQDLQEIPTAAVSQVRIQIFVN